VEADHDRDPLPGTPLSLRLVDADGLDAGGDDLEQLAATLGRLGLALLEDRHQRDEGLVLAHLREVGVVPDPAEIPEAGLPGRVEEPRRLLPVARSP
jgi:hypothetical protein